MMNNVVRQNTCLVSTKMLQHQTLVLLQQRGALTFHFIIRHRLPFLCPQELGDLRFCYRQEGLKREREIVTHVTKETSCFVTENGERKICSLSLEGELEQEIMEINVTFISLLGLLNKVR